MRWLSRVFFRGALFSGIVRTICHLLSAMSTCGCLFGFVLKKPTYLEDVRRELSARRLILWMVGV